MPAGTLRTIAVVAAFLSGGAFAADRHSVVDPAAPYKANRLSSPRASQPILNIPGQTTVLTRQVLDDMNATSVRDALRSTAGVTVGR
jgi:outer membrane receptor for monomeric catechols